MHPYTHIQERGRHWPTFTESIEVRSAVFRYVYVRLGYTGWFRPAHAGGWKPGPASPTYPLPSAAVRDCRCRAAAAVRGCGECLLPPYLPPSALRAPCAVLTNHRRRR